MGNSAAKAPEVKAAEGEKKLKPCCACPETKQIRDTWWASISNEILRLSYYLPEKRSWTCSIWNIVIILFLKGVESM